MGFRNETLSEKKVKEIIQKYKLSAPWPGHDDTMERNLTMCVRDTKKDALFASIQGQFGRAHNGFRVDNAFDGVGVLIWMDTAVRIDYYEDIIGQNKEIVIIATKIVAPEKIRPHSDKLLFILKEALLAYRRSSLPPANKDLKLSFKNTAIISFNNGDKIWQQQ